MTTFIDDDEGYFYWLAHHPEGFVLNTLRNPTASYLRLHRATCQHIQRRAERRLTAEYIKICSDDKGDLAAWALAKVRGTLDPCRSCTP